MHFLWRYYSLCRKIFQKDQTRKGKISCGWSFGQQTNGMDASERFYMWIWRSPNFKIPQSHQKITRNKESKYILMKKVIVHSETAKITVTKRYMHLWNACLVMRNVLVEILVTVHNRPIGFWILKQRATRHQRFQILFHDFYKIGINKLKLRTYIMSPQNKKVKYE